LINCKNIRSFSSSQKLHHDFAAEEEPLSRVGVNQSLRW